MGLGEVGMVVVQVGPDCSSGWLPVGEVACLAVGVQPRVSMRSWCHQGVKVPSGAAMWMARVLSGLRVQVNCWRRNWPERKA